MIYNKVFVEIYNWCNRRQVHETYRMVKLEKYPISRIENPLNLGAHQFFKIFEVLQNAYIMSKNTEGNTIYVNNYINWN